MDAPGAAGGDAEIQSSMPLPVAHYWKQYTTTNVACGAAPKPPAPIKGQYMMFGQKYCEEDCVIRPLETQGLPRLYPQKYDKKAELKKLVASIICSFIDLLDIVTESPSSPRRLEKLEDLNVLVINIHHIINEFRPHQARETLKVMMELQKREIIDASKKLTEGINQANELIAKYTEEVSRMEMDEADELAAVTSSMSIQSAAATSSSAMVEGDVGLLDADEVMDSMVEQGLL